MDIFYLEPEEVDEEGGSEAQRGDDGDYKERVSAGLGETVELLQITYVTNMAVWI